MRLASTVVHQTKIVALLLWTRKGKIVPGVRQAEEATVQWSRCRVGRRSFDGVQVRRRGAGRYVVDRREGTGLAGLRASRLGLRAGWDGRRVGRAKSRLSIFRQPLRPPVYAPGPNSSLL